MFLPLLFSCLAFSLAASFTSCPGGYKNGEKIKEGQFVKQCTVTPKSYSINLIGCLTTKGTEIPLGTKLEENKLVFNCISTVGGGAKMETTPAASSGSSGPSLPKENLKCNGKYVNGQKYTDGSFVKQCSSTPTSSATSIVACLIPSGKEIAVGAKAEEGKLIYSCVKTEKGATIETDIAIKGCEDGKYQKGQTYLSSNQRFLLKCVDDYGSNDIVACMTEDGKEIKVGAELTVDVFKYKCVKESNGSVKYLKEVIEGTTPVQKGCGRYAIGQTILSEDGKFKFTCISVGKIEFTACIVEGGEVKADTKQTIETWNYHCQSSPNGGASLSKKRTP